jgi:hypothetical protein
MARQQSSSELAGSLAATLTASAPRASEPPPHIRKNENSGLFDVGALYAETFNEVMRRARSDARLGSLVRAARPAARAAARWPRPAPAFEPPHVAAVPIEVTIPVEGPRSRGLGWFGVAVAWLATVTMGASIATTVPGHALTRLRAGVPAPAVPTPAPHSQAGSLPTAPLPVTAAAVMPAPVLPAVVMPAPIAPVASPSPALTPPAMAWSERPIAAQADSPRVSAKKVLPRAVTPVAHARPAAPSASAATAPPAPVIAAAPRPTAPSRPASAPTSASTAGMSLDELIRHEVQAESAKHP